MAQYFIKAKNDQGQTEKFYRQGETREELIAQLHEANYFVLEVTEAAEGMVPKAQKGKYRREELLMFTRLLSTVVRANIPLVTGLDIIAKQVSSPFFMGLVRDLENSLRQGLSLSQAMERYPTVFDPLYVNMVRAGELTGKMGSILPNLFQYIKKSYGLRKKVIAALLYPMIIFFVAVGIIFFFIYFLIPQLEEMFTSFGARLPDITVFILNISSFVRSNSLWLVLFVALLVVGFIIFKRSERGAFWLDRFYLRLPIWGDLLQKIYMVRFAYTFSVLYGNEVAILDSLEIVSQGMGNRFYKRAIQRAALDIEVGVGIEEAFSAQKAFPDLVIQMLSIGEASRRVDEMLEELADFYDSEVDVALETMTGVIQPVTIVVLGIFIAITLVALFLPIFNLSGIVH